MTDGQAQKQLFFASGQHVCVINTLLITPHFYIVNTGVHRSVHFFLNLL